MAERTAKGDTPSDRPDDVAARTERRYHAPFRARRRPARTA
jgi:hypothetical protein